MQERTRLLQIPAKQPCARFSQDDLVVRVALYLVWCEQDDELLVIHDEGVAEFQGHKAATPDGHHCQKHDHGGIAQTSSVFEVGFR